MCALLLVSGPAPESSIEVELEYCWSNWELSLKLRYNTATTNVFEVYINNPEEDFYLQLTTEKDNEVVWEVPIRLNGQKGCSSSHAVCFVDKYMNELTQKVRLVSPIADDLKPLI
ncbi:hypothetical protein SRHO_G00252640 [Serrasalmus rhombeus]